MIIGVFCDKLSSEEIKSLTNHNKHIKIYPYLNKEIVGVVLKSNNDYFKGLSYFKKIFKELGFNEYLERHIITFTQF